MRILELNPGESLVAVSAPEALPMLSELLQPHWRPRVAIVGTRVYLVAANLFDRRVFDRAMKAATEYDTVNLEAESNVTVPSPSRTEHLARLRIAKARGSNLAQCMINSIQQAHKQDRVHGKILSLRNEQPWVLAAWKNQVGDQVLGWGELEQYRENEKYGGELMVIIDRSGKKLPRWVRMPEDDELLLGHSLPEDESGAGSLTLEQSGAAALGITERLLGGAQ